MHTSFPDTHTLIGMLKKRFEENMHRHKAIKWQEVQSRLELFPEKIPALAAMEATGGMPDVLERNPKTGMLLFFDCAPESPKDRRSLCYDRTALESRKTHRPENNATDMATTMGVSMLTEEQYRRLQSVEAFDLKTSSWIHTPPEIRALGGALFCDRRYDKVFVYHNGAQSYYSSRGFRTVLAV